MKEIKCNVKRQMTAVRGKKRKTKQKGNYKKNSSEKNVLRRIMTYSTNNYIYIREPKPFTKNVKYLPIIMKLS